MRLVVCFSLTAIFVVAALFAGDRGMAPNGVGGVGLEASGIPTVR